MLKQEVQASCHRSGRMDQGQEKIPQIKQSYLNSRLVSQIE
jgi:hypothetical protein